MAPCRSGSCHVHAWRANHLLAVGAVRGPVAVGTANSVRYMFWLAALYTSPATILSPVIWFTGILSYLCTFDPSFDGTFPSLAGLLLCFRWIDLHRWSVTLRGFRTLFCSQYWLQQSKENILGSRAGVVVTAPLPPMWHGFDFSPVPSLGWVCRWFLPCPEAFSSGCLVFLRSQKPTSPKIPIRPG